MKKNSSLVIGLVSIVLIIAWMFLFIKYSNSFVVNIYFLAINTLLIVYLIETKKSKKNVNMERVILISSIIFCCICCFMEYINKLTVPFIILSLLIVYMFYYLILTLSYLNKPKKLIFETSLCTLILGVVNERSWQVLALLFLSIKSYISYISTLYENNLKNNDDYEKKKNVYKLKLLKLDAKIDLMILFVYVSILLSDYLLAIGSVELFSKFVFDGTNKIMMIFSKGFLTIFIFLAFLFISIFLGIVIKKYFPDMEKNIIERILNDKF